MSATTQSDTSPIIWSTATVEQYLKELFSISLSNNPSIDYAKYPKVFIVCREFGQDGPIEKNRYCLFPWEANVMRGSPICKKLTKVICPAMVACVPENYIVGRDILDGLAAECPFIIFPDSQEYFRSGYIETIEDFFEYIQFADRYMLNIPYICSHMDRMMWLIMMKERQKDIWRTNSILLTDIETKLVSKNKFSDDPRALPAGPAPYPVAPRPTRTSSNKYITMTDMPKQKFLSPIDFSLLISLLLKSHANDFVAKIIAVMAPSIEYCDLIFSNYEIITMTRGLPSFHSSVFYALRVLYLEELSMYYRKKGPGRFILPLSAATALPIIPTIHPKYSPYLSTLAWNQTAMSTGLTLPALLKGPRGLYSLSEFRKRLKVFSGNILKYIQWKTPTSLSALSGSAITACAVRTPLEKCFESLEEYFDEYYPRRTIKKYTASHICDVLNDPLYLYFREDEAASDNGIASEEDDNIADDISNVAPSPDSQVIHDIDYTDIDIMIACPWDQFDMIADQHFAAIRRAADDEKIYNEPTMEYVETENKHKYVIKGLGRDIDIFHVDDIPSVIVKYHLDIVRAYYTGDELWCFPSFISAANTGLNTDIRWTSNRKDVRDIVLKYFQRGFGTILNSADRNNLINFVNNSEQWPHLNAPTQQRGRYNWRATRYWKLPLFHNISRAMFNPSYSRLGIHYALNTTSKCVNLLCNYDITHKIRHKNARKGGPGNDFRSNNKGAEILLPFVCKSISDYL